MKGMVGLLCALLLASPKRNHSFPNCFVFAAWSSDAEGMKMVERCLKAAGTGSLFLMNSMGCQDYVVEPHYVGKVLMLLSKEMWKSKREAIMSGNVLVVQPLKTTRP